MLANKNRNWWFKYLSLSLSTLLGVVSFWIADLEWYSAISITLTCYWLLHFLNALGSRIVILEVIIILALLQWLCGTSATYEVFNKHNDLASLWDTYMRLPANEYFLFVIPGTIGLILGLRFPLQRLPIPNHQILVERTKAYLENKSYIGIIMCLIGTSVFFIVPFVPSLFRNILYLFSQLIYVGLFYVLFSKKTKYKALTLTAVLVLTLVNTVMTGMYGGIVLWGMLFVIMYFMQNPSTFLKKILVFGSGILLILLIQSIKHEYREATWGQDMARNSDFSLFGNLIADRISDPSKLVQEEAIFNAATRANQGSLIAKTMDYVPKQEPFAHGETIVTSIAAAIIPRFIWPDKPKVGGADNIRRFLGVNRKLEYSFNISPLGEGYANFGKKGGVIFIFFYGLFFNWAFRYCLALSVVYPTLILWLPLLFVGALGVETDILTTLGSFIKSAMFAWFVFWFSRVFLKVKI